jgi:hypothetical protein
MRTSILICPRSGETCMFVQYSWSILICPRSRLKRDMFVQLAMARPGDRPRRRARAVHCNVCVCDEWRIAPPADAIRHPWPAAAARSRLHFQFPSRLLLARLTPPYPLPNGKGNLYYSNFFSLEILVILVLRYLNKHGSVGRLSDNPV